MWSKLGPTRVFENIKKIFLELDNEYYILCGDLNLVINEDLDNCNYTKVNNPKLLEVMDDLEIVDYFRVLIPDKKYIYMEKKRVGFGLHFDLRKFVKCSGKFYN